jgi:site-specific recombinase XerD
MGDKSSPSWNDLRQTDLSAQVIRTASAPYRPLLHDFAAWLARDRGLAPVTIHSSLLLGRRFLERIASRSDPVPTLQGLTVEDIESFFVNLSSANSVGMRRNWRTLVCRLLLFAASRGWVTPLLANSVPAIRTYRLAHVVRGIEDDQIRRLLESVPDDSPTDLRDRAILLMLAVYGVRSGQLQALKLEDVSWQDHTICFREHKGGKPVLHELLPQVAGTLARYIQEARPEVPHRAIFLLVRQPHTPLCPTGIGSIVRDRLTRAGLSTRSKGSHMFRHAFATRLLRTGHPLKTIADLLGHRDLGSATIYTKVDEPSLREVANEWPEVLP